MLDALEPSPEARRLMRDYIDGKREISDVLRIMIERQRAGGNA
jgi:hypothetical protein